jgi:hypothetical protein
VRPQAHDWKMMWGRLVDPVLLEKTKSVRNAQHIRWYSASKAHPCGQTMSPPQTLSRSQAAPREIPHHIPDFTPIHQHEVTTQGRIRVGYSATRLPSRIAVHF